jgi:hypothetical protein
VKISGRKIHQHSRKFTLLTISTAANTPDDSNEMCRFLHSDEVVSRDRLSSMCNIPPLFWTALCQEASGFFWAKQEAGQATTCQTSPSSTYFRFLVKHGIQSAKAVTPQSLDYHWEKAAFASSWSLQRGLVMLCFDVPADLQEKIGESLLTGDVAKYGQGPFSLHAVLVVRIVESFDRAVWSWRDIVRDLERTRVSEDTSEKRSFEYMHETARHVIHCSEMLSTAISVAEGLVNEVTRDASHQRDPASSTIVKDLEFSISLLRGLRNRSQALEKRLENETNLASRDCRALFAGNNPRVRCANTRDLCRRSI